mgnify:CR=1 FL=1
MKKIILSFFISIILAGLIFIALSASAQDLKIAEQNGKYGFVDKKGRFVIKPTFESLSDFHDGLAAALQGKWGFINKKGEFVIQPQYDKIADFQEGLAYVVYETEQRVGQYESLITSYIAYINKHGKIIIPFYEGGPYFYSFSDGLVAIQEGDAIYCSYKDKKGKIILDKDYFEKTGWKNTTDAVCHNFSEGLLPVYKYTDETYKTRLSAFMNKKGEIVYSKKFVIPDEVEPLCDFDTFSQGMATFRVNWKYGFIDKNFKEVIPPIYDFAYEFKDGLSLVEKDEKWFYIDKRGNFIKNKD